jgi:exonuclease III
MKNQQVTFWFNNIASWLNGARNSAEGSTQFFVSQSPSEIYDNPQTDIIPMVKPLLEQDSDVLSFSEVFWSKQRDQLTAMLKNQGYTVYVTDAFEMWSQSEAWEHLYNIIGVKEDKIWKPKVEHKEFRNKRKLEGIVISAKYLLSDASWEWEKTKVQQARNIHRRLATWILDGAISFLEFENFTLVTGHVHKFNEEVRNIIQWRISEKPMILLGDMNVAHGKKILTQPPFNTIDWKSLVHPEQRTFGFVNWLSIKDRITLATAHMQPDVLVVKWIEEAMVRFYQTPSDHNGIGATITIESSEKETVQEI